MNPNPAQLPPATAWIDPFCPLLSDRVGVRPGDPPMPLDTAARRTAKALAYFAGSVMTHAPAALVNGVPASLDDAVAAAADLIGRWRQPLFGGLGTDVAGARALTGLALHRGAILDHAHGETMTQSLRALQDRGGSTCTLSEVRNRADLVVCVGADLRALAPDFFQRCGIGEAVPGAPPLRRVLFLQTAAGLEDALQSLPGVQAQTLALHNHDLHQTLAELNAACYGRALARASEDWPVLQALAAQLREARYAVLVYVPSQLPGDHAALLIEAIGRLVRTLNRTTRAATLAVGDADGSATVNQTVTWLTGFPLRTALYAHGFEHDPHRFGARRLLQEGAADGLLWVSSFSPELLPPTSPDKATPMVVLGHPAMAAPVRHLATDAASESVFIAVSTPGVNAPGHLFRADGGIVLALKPFMPGSLPGVAEVARRLLELLEARV